MMYNGDDEDETKSNHSAYSNQSMYSTTSTRTGIASAVHEWPTEDLLEHLLPVPDLSEVQIPPGAQRIFVNLPGPLLGEDRTVQPARYYIEENQWRRTYVYLVSCPVGEYDKVTLEWEPAPTIKPRDATSQAHAQVSLSSSMGGSARQKQRKMTFPDPDANPAVASWMLQLPGWQQHSDPQKEHAVEDYATTKDDATAHIMKTARPGEDGRIPDDRPDPIPARHGHIRIRNDASGPVVVRFVNRQARHGQGYEESGAVDTPGQTSRGGATLRISGITPAQAREASKLKSDIKNVLERCTELSVDKIDLFDTGKDQAKYFVMRDAQGIEAADDEGRDGGTYYQSQYGGSTMIPGGTGRSKTLLAFAVFPDLIQCCTAQEALSKHAHDETNLSSLRFELDQVLMADYIQFDFRPFCERYFHYEWDGDKQRVMELGVEGRGRLELCYDDADALPKELKAPASTNQPAARQWMARHQDDPVTMRDKALERSGFKGYATHSPASDRGQRHDLRDAHGVRDDVAPIRSPLSPAGLAVTRGREKLQDGTFCVANTCKAKMRLRVHGRNGTLEVLGSVEYPAAHERLAKAERNKKQIQKKEAKTEIRRHQNTLFQKRNIAEQKQRDVDQIEQELATKRDTLQEQGYTEDYIAGEEESLQELLEEAIAAKKEAQEDLDAEGTRLRPILDALVRQAEVDVDEDDDFS